MLWSVVFARCSNARSNTEDIRRSLRVLEEQLSREELRRQFREASAKVRSSAVKELRVLEPLTNDGLDDV